MGELSLAQSFSLVALNAQDSRHLTNAKKVSLRCMAAATILEFVLENRVTKEGEIVKFDKKALEISSTMYQDAVIEALSGSKDTLEDTLPNILKRVTTLSGKKLKAIEHAFAGYLVALGLLEEIPALLGCDLEFETASISMKEYRSEASYYSRIAESLRAEVLEKGPMSDETVLMLWLLRESSCLYDLFSKEELKRVAERNIELLENNELAKSLYGVNVHKSIETGIKNFLKLKKEVMATPVGSGFNFVFPFIERSQSIFIDTESYFANKAERMRVIRERLEKHGHTYEVVRDGDVPIIKIDNVLYEAVPHAKQYRVPVHGVRLRKYPLSL